jgi:hypothetical protein
MKIFRQSRRNRGYTLVEALVASALLGAMIGGAVSMVGTMNLSERTAYAGTVALNMQDCAAHLWQLGLSPTEVLIVLPNNTNNEFVDSSLVVNANNSVTFGTATTTTLANSMGSLENISCSVTIKDQQGVNNRTNTVQVYRPVLR